MGSTVTLTADADSASVFTGWSGGLCTGTATCTVSMSTARSFAINPDAYDPHYHFQLAVDAGLNAYAAPLGMIEAD